MNVVICGAGRVGYSIASYLSREANNITVIDINPALVSMITRELDVNGIVGHAASPEVLSKAQLDEADMIIAVTYSDEVNMVATQVAHSIFNVPKKIARIRNQDYRHSAWTNLFSRDHMPIDMIISPEVEVAKSIHDRLHITGATDVIPLHDNLIYMVGAICDENCPVLHTPLYQLRELFPYLSVKIACIVREQKPFIPKRDSQLLVGDEVYFMVPADQVTQAMEYLGVPQKQSRGIVVVGGGHVGFELLAQMKKTNSKLNVKMIELDKGRAEFIADNNENVLVLNGNGLDPDILREAGIAGCEAFVAVTDDDETNALASLQAKRLGVGRALTLLNRSSYSDLLLSIDIDAIISPQDITVSKIMRHVRRGRIKSVYNLRNSFGEIVEAVASESCRIINTPLKDLDIPSEVQIGAIIRDEAFIPALPDTVIKPGDYVIILALQGFGTYVEKLFCVEVDLF